MSEASPAENRSHLNSIANSIEARISASETLAEFRAATGVTRRSLASMTKSDAEKRRRKPRLSARSPIKLN